MTYLVEGLKRNVPSRIWTLCVSFLAKLAVSVAGFVIWGGQNAFISCKKVFIYQWMKSFLSYCL